jgi:hypothetical protein
MTSDATNDETVAFFEKYEYFGLPRDQVCIFAIPRVNALAALRTGVFLRARRVPGTEHRWKSSHAGTAKTVVCGVECRVTG